MQLSFNEERLNRLVSAPTLQPFCEKTVSFLNELSIQLMKTSRSFSDVITFAYWCRKAAITSYKKEYDDLDRRLGRGVVFHIAPSNVPVNFAFSMAAGLLAGNKNIVRLPSKDFPQVDLICNALDLAFEKYPEMMDYVYPVKYDKTSNYTDIISSKCNVRVIWGGDNTIGEIRKSPIPPRAYDITFADRFSLSVIDSDDYCKAENKDAIVTGFYNDTYFSDQNACTSPRIVCWVGGRIQDAKADFWNRVQTLVSEKYSFEPVQAVGKLDALYMASIKQSCRLEDESTDNSLMRIRVEKLNEGLMECHYHSGFFFEHELKEMADIVPLCNEKCQTVSYYGDIKEAIKEAIVGAGVTGCDRIVPIGKTMDFTLIWDGHDLIRNMSRVVNVI